MNKKIMVLLSIVEQGNGKKLIKDLKDFKIFVNFQTVGLGTAPTEMMDIFGIGTKEKDVIISLVAENYIRDLLPNLGEAFQGRSRYGGLMIVLDTSAAGRVLSEILYFGGNQNTEKGTVSMKNENQNYLIVISVNEGYSQEVMNVARKAGAMGGTVMKGRLADNEKFNEFVATTVDEDRELLFILAPGNVGKQIMEDVNKDFGIKSAANGIIFALSAEKAFKI